MYLLQIKTNVHDASYYQQEDYALVSIVASAAKVKIQANSLHDDKLDGNLDDVMILARYALLHPIQLLIRL